MYRSLLNNQNQVAPQLIGVSLKIIFQVGLQWRRPRPENVITRDCPLIGSLSVNLLVANPLLKVPTHQSLPPLLPRLTQGSGRIVSSRGRDSGRGADDLTLQSPTTKKPRNSNTRNYKCLNILQSPNLIEKYNFNQQYLWQSQPVDFLTIYRRFLDLGFSYTTQLCSH